MKIVVARTGGFCMGVRRAMDLALEHTSPSGPRVYTLGKLIHNRSAVELLQNRGAKVLDENTTLPSEAKILIRAHGVPPEKEESLQQQGHEIIDGTCPKVKTVHRVITRYRSLGYSVVITGDTGHAEVVGLLGYAGPESYLIHGCEDVERLPELEKVCLVSQTTFDSKMFDSIAACMRERFDGKDVVVKKTVCSATARRQEETRRIAREVNALVVVGGKDSANTLRLAAIARSEGTTTQHVETESEIDWDAISSCEVVGITAGASTPQWLIKRVVEHLQYLTRTGGRSAPGVIGCLFDVLTHLNVILAAGAGAMYYAACTFQGYPYHPIGSVLAFLYFLSMYLWNSLASIEMTPHLGMQRYRFYHGHRTSLFVAAGASIGILLGLSFLQNRTLLYLMLFATVAGSLYHMTIVPRFLRPIVKYANLRDVPTSRDLFVALAWGILLTFIPQALTQRFSLTAPTILTFVWIFSLAYLRSLIFDLRDIEGDRIMGRETLVSFIGERRARKTIKIGIWSMLALVGAYSAAEILLNHRVTPGSILFLSQLPVLLYMYLVEELNRRKGIRRASAFAALTDAQFLLAGLLVLLASWAKNAFSV